MKCRLLVLIVMWSFSIKAYGQQNSGLTGLLYDDIKLSRISSIWNLESVNSSEVNWPAKKDFSAKWIGYINAPVSGEISFYGEADNEMQLVIDGKIVINGWNESEKETGKLKVKKDRLYPLALLYSQKTGSSYMRVFWSWEGHSKEIIPATALSYDINNEEKMLKEFNSQVDVDFSQLKFDVGSIIDIHSGEDVIKKREEVIDWLWGADGFPFDKLPDNITEGIIDTNFVSLQYLKRIDKLSINMDFGLNSIVYHFIPQNANGSAAIYHQGHGGKFSIGIRTINAFLEKGYDVFALSMPLLGMNKKPVLNSARFGKMIIHTHSQMDFLDPKNGHTIKYFMEPVAIVVNFMEKSNFKKLTMIGLSGGGWTTTLYSAIDPRIQVSFPVAGSLPMYLRAQVIGSSGSLGDYEQLVSELYKKANFLELYVMGSYGKGRRQLQILNEFDACCFMGTEFKTYKEIVKERVKSLNSGSYDIFLDSTHRLHQISPKALEVIFYILEKNKN